MSMSVCEKYFSSGSFLNVLKTVSSNPILITSVEIENIPPSQTGVTSLVQTLFNAD